MLKKIILLTLILVPTTQTLFAYPSIESLMKKIEFNMEMQSDIKANVTLTQQKTGQGIKSTQLIYFRRDSDDSFLIILTAPETERGNGYLRVSDNFWMYRQNTRTFQHISRDESIAGTDAKGEDFEKRKLTELYEPAKDAQGKEIISEEMLGKIPVYRFEIKAKVNDVDYPKKIYWMQKDTNLTLKQLSYSLSGTLMHTAYFLKYTNINGKFIPVQQIHIDEFEKGNKTIVEISNIETKKLNDKIFTKAYLENLSK